MNSIPDWIKKLSKGDNFILSFPHSQKTVLAEVIENSPTTEESLYFGTITVNYKVNNFAKQDDLLYDDYSKESDNQNNWCAYIVI